MALTQWRPRENEIVHIWTKISYITEHLDYQISVMLILKFEKQGLTF